MTPNGKSPYEIRLNLLELAFDVLKSQRDFDKVMPPTTEEIVAEANKMNVFICAKSDHR